MAQLSSRLQHCGALAHSPLVRILLTNDDGVNARGLRLLEVGRAQAHRRHLDRRPGRGAIRRGPFADADRAGAAAQARRPPLLGHGHADRRGDAGAGAHHEGFAARRDHVGDQPRRQPRRGRHLFGNGIGGDGRRARRRSLDRAQPGLFTRGHGRHRALRGRRGMGRAGAGAADRVRDRAAGP